MELQLEELEVLREARADDFQIERVVGVGQNGMVVAARCSLKGIPDPTKLYAVKLLFTFTHEYSSIIRNSYENEWLILSRLLPQDNIVRFWTQFISFIPDSFCTLLSSDVRACASYRSRSGQTVRKKGQFLVLDYHPQTLHSWLSKSSLPLPYQTTLKLTLQLLKAVQFLETHLIRHLDLKLGNLLMSHHDQIVLCDFGCAVQFPDNSFALPYTRGMIAGGNKAHLAPEVLNAYHQNRKNPTKSVAMDYSHQTSFAVGVLAHELAVGHHPLPDYPLAYTSDGTVTYSSEDLLPLPSEYPKSFCSIVTDMLRAEPEKRLSVAEALKQLDVCCVRRQSQEGASMSLLQAELQKARQERDLAKAKLSSVASERDFAVGEMKVMAEQCQNVAGEFEQMAKHCDQLMTNLEQVRHERDSAVKASESAYEACEMLREQLGLVTRERDLANTKVAELHKLTSRCHSEEPIRECGRCQKFYLESENTSETCYWHPGDGEFDLYVRVEGYYLISLSPTLADKQFNRWSCCYKRDASAVGCKSAKHVLKYGE